MIKNNFFKVFCNSILDYHSIQWCKIHDNVCTKIELLGVEIRIGVLHIKSGKNTDENMLLYFLLILKGKQFN